MAAFLLALWGLLLVPPQAPCGEEYFVVYPRHSDQLWQRRPGNKLVFEYGCQTKGFGKTMARDSGIRHSVTFEVDAQSHAFYLEDQALLGAKVYLSRRCRCKPLVYDHLKGSIEGYRTTSGQWKITIALAAVDAKGKEVVKLNSTGTYRLQ